MKISYRTSGVNINEGDKFVDSIKPIVSQTFDKNVISGVGNFGALYKIPTGFKNPVLVSSTDGVGTKLKIAIELGKHDTIGEDLVNHCVNDIAVCSATPLFFFDYIACGKLRSKVAVEIVKGLVRGCKRNKVSLIGGETAEMPGMYSANDYDLAGMIVGIAEQKKILDKRKVKAGNVLIGLPSNGLHTNGYSLARKVLLKKYRLNQKVKEIGGSIGGELLKVHRSYLKEIKLLTSRIKVSSISHITGGGILGNTKRVVPSSLKINIDWRTWKRPKIFSLIQQTGNIDEQEMRNVFNLGIGIIFIVPKSEVLKAKKLLIKNKIKHYIIGNITR